MPQQRATTVAERLRLMSGDLTAAERKEFRRILDKLSQWLNAEFVDELARLYPESAAARRGRPRAARE